MGRLTHRTGSGWTYFITTKAWQSTLLFQVEETAQIIVAKMLEYRDQGNYLLHDFVLMPNHLHLILTPAESVSLEKAMQLIKGGSSFEIHKVRGQKLQIWQPGFHESRVTCWTDYQKKRDYIQFNPVAAKLIDRPELWPYGSANVKFGLDPIPQGLKPVPVQLNVGPEGPTPAAPTRVSALQGLKPLPPKEPGKAEEKSSFAVQTPVDGTESSAPGALTKKVGV
jgi:putative transposase